MTGEGREGRKGEVLVPDLTWRFVADPGLTRC